jgi:hypothetical protein
MQQLRGIYPISKTGDYLASEMGTEITLERGMVYRVF